MFTGFYLFICNLEHFLANHNIFDSDWNRDFQHIAFQMLRHYHTFLYFQWPRMTFEYLKTLDWLKTFLIELCTFWMLIKSICFVRAKVSISNTRRHRRCCRWSGHKCPRSGRNRFMRCGGRTITGSWINWNISTSIKLFLWSKTKTRSIFVWSPTVR